MGIDVEALRAEFVQYQYGFHQFSDHYSVVASFAAKKMGDVEKLREALTKIAENDSDGLHTYTPQAMQAIATAALATPKEDTPDA